MVNTIFILDSRKQTSQILSTKTGSINTFWDDLYTQEFDTGAESFEFTCNSSENIKEGNYVAFFYNKQYKLFSIIEVEEQHKNGKLASTCYCETSVLELLNHHIRPFSGDKNCIEFFQYILNETGWAIGKWSSSLTDNIQTVNVDKITSVWSLIEEYKEVYECEINIRVSYDNGRITGQYIDLFSEGNLGDKTYKRFEYGRNVTGITKSKDLYDWCTGIIIDCDCDVSDKIFSIGNGDKFDKSAGDVILNKSANDKYNNGRPYIMGVYSGKETDPTLACINAWKELVKRSEPKFDYEVDTALTSKEYEEINLGDTVHVIDNSYTPALLLEARVGTLELSFTDKTKNKCTLTNYKELKSAIGNAELIKLTGTITDVVNTFFPVGSDGIADGAIIDGKISTTYYQQITADIVSASTGAFEDLYAKGLTVINADIDNLRAGKADITDLNAANGNITNLTSQVGQIETIINNHFTGTDAQVLNITAENTTIGNAVIKDAMIESVNAGKITAGSIDTNKVIIQSEDGGIKIEGATQQFKDDTGTVRVQIGKDAQGNFTFCLFSQDGTGILLDETGIKAGAVPDGLIVNDMVADNANISGNKIDIASVITNINNNTTSIKSSAIKFDDTGQSLLVAFNELKNTVDTIEEVTIQGDLSSVIEKVNTHTTQIGVMQGQISSLISNTTITKQDGTVTQLKDEYNSTKTTVDSHTSKIGSLETNYDKVSGNLASVTSKQSTLEQNLDEVSSTLTSTTTTANEAKSQSSTNKQTIDSMSTELTSATATANSALNKATTAQQNLDGFKTTVSKTYVTKTDAGDTYATKSALSEVKQTADGLTTEVSKKLNSADLSSRIQQSATDIKIGFNQITDFITIDQTNGFKINHEDGSYTCISAGGLELYQASTGYRYKSLIATGNFSIEGKGTAVVTLPAQFDKVEDYEIEIFYTIETSWAGTSSMVDKTCICEMYANDLYHTYMEKDSNGHWTQKVDYCLKDVCVKKGLSMEVGDIGDMSGYVHWIAFA